MKITHNFLLVLATLAPLAIQAQYYGIIDNFQGAGRYPATVNLTSKDGSTVNSGFFSGGGAGGGAGETADIGPLGTGDKALGGGGAIQGGFIGYSFGLNTSAAPINIDLTAVQNGRQNTGFTIDLQNTVADSDTYGIRLESGGFADSKLFTINPASSTAWATYTFNLATDGVVSGNYNPANITQIVFLPLSDGTSGNHDWRIDNMGFTGNYAPTSGLVENFQGFTAQTLGAGIVTLPAANNFGGASEAFAYGGGAVTSIQLVDLGGGDIAGRWTFTTNEGGIVFDLGSPGAQTDLTSLGFLEIDLAVSEAGDQVDVLVEDINAPEFADRCFVTPAVTTTPTKFVYNLSSSFTCGAQGLNKTKVHRVSILPKTTQGNGITITVNNIRFAASGSAVDNWESYSK